MRFPTLAVLLGAAVVFASPSSIVQDVDGVAIPEICGNSISDDAVAAAEGLFAANKASVPPINARVNDFVIEVYFHVIGENNTSQGGNIPDSVITDQMRVLNEGFAGSGVFFDLVKTDRTINVDWFNNVEPGSEEQTAMKEHLGQGGPTVLNIYSVNLRGGLLGYTTFPWDYLGNPKDDGIVFQYTTVPGGGTEGYDTGKILTHEVGHWVGLLHTFQGGCDELGGDLVFDTPAEAYPVRGCIDQDTCPKLPGDDPIDNHMDYSSDACRVRFTPGQFKRLREQLVAFRNFVL